MGSKTFLGAVQEDGGRRTGTIGRLSAGFEAEPGLRFRLPWYLGKSTTVVKGSRVVPPNVAGFPKRDPNETVA